MTATHRFIASVHQARRARRRSSVLAAGIAATLFAAAAQPQSLASDEDVARVLDAFNPYVSLGLAYDSNIYRLDDDAPTIGDTMADEYGTLAAGFDTHFERALQGYDLSAEISRTMFNEHDELDYTGSKAHAVWHWVASEAIKGDLGVRHRRSLRDFANQATFDRFKDMRMENAVFASGDVSLPNNLGFGLRAELADVSFSETERLDLKRTIVGGDVGYTSASGSRVSLDAEYAMGRYDNTPASDFDEYTIGPKVQWKLGARTAVEAMLGYSARDYDDPTRNDYDGVTGHVSVTMEHDGRNQLTASVYRELSTLGDEIADFAVVDGIKVEPSFRVREGLDLRVVAGYEKRDFDRDPSADVIPLPINADRTDDVYTAGAFLDWQIHRNIKISIGADMQRRDSTRALQDYDFNRFQIQVTGQL